MKINWNNIEEPIRSIANKVVAFVVSLSAVLVMLTQLTDFLPASYRDKATAVLVAVGAVCSVIIKIGGEIGRNQVTPVAKIQKDTANAKASQHLRKP